MDFDKLISLIKGGLFEPDSTWANYSANRTPWLDTATAFSLPVIVISALLTLVFGWLFSSFSMFGGGGFTGFIWALLAGCISLAMWAWIAAFFARMFGDGASAAPQVTTEQASEEPVAADLSQANPGGAPTFDQGVAAISFAFLPGYIGSVLGTIPWLGALLSLAGLVFGVIFMYRCFPVFLGVAEEDRVKHFIATLVAGVVAAVILFSVLGALGLGAAGAGAYAGGSAAERMERQAREAIARNDDSRSAAEAANDIISGNESRSGDLLGIGQQTEYLEAADKDSYTPPQNGKLTKQQVALAVRFLETTKAMRDEKSKRLQDISEKADNNENPSLGDLFGGFKDVMDMGTAEMQVVKSGSGNWAEHQWVKQALSEARIHKDLNDTIRHNWSLYSVHAEALDELL